MNDALKGKSIDALKWAVQAASFYFQSTSFQSSMTRTRRIKDQESCAVREALHEGNEAYRFEGRVGTMQCSSAIYTFISQGWRSLATGSKARLGVGCISIQMAKITRT